MKEKRRFAFFALCSLMATSAAATEVGLAGVFPGKAILTINGGQPRAVAVGATLNGVTVVSVLGDTVTLIVDGKQRAMRVGQNVAALRSADTPQSVKLISDVRGHFTTTGYINGVAVRFLVDTGATLIAIGMNDARRLALDTAQGARSLTSTANGMASATHVKLNTVKIGDVTLNGVDALVLETDMSHALLGMSFLNRMEMTRNGDTMVLKKRY